MPVPKRRLSRRKTKVNMKKKIKKVSNMLKNSVVCKKCGHLKLPHFKCFNCGSYE